MRLDSPIVKWLGNRKLGLLILIGAIASRCMTQLYFFKLGSDRALQLVAAKNFSLGNGFVLRFADPLQPLNDLVQPLIGWPPGYPFFVGCLSILFDGNVLLAAIVFDLLCVTLLVISCHQLLRAVGCSGLVVNLFTLVLGLFLYDFLEISTSDLNAIAFLVCTVWLSIVFISKEKKQPWLLLLITAMNFMVPLLRYMFIPSAFIIPVYLLITGIRRNQRHLRNAGICSTVSTLVLLTGLFLFQQTNTGSPVYVYPTAMGFYPENLLGLYPFIFFAFINLDFYYTLAEIAGVLRFGQYSYFFWISNLVLLGFLIYHFVRHFIFPKKRPTSRTEHFLLMGSLISLAILGVLIMLSLAFAPTLFTTHQWTYVEEARYMGFIILFLQMLLFTVIFNRWKTLSKWMRTLGTFLAVLLFLECAHGIYLHGKILSSDKKLFGQNQSFLRQKAYIEQLCEQNPNSTGAVFSSRDASYIGLANLAGARSLYGLPDIAGINNVKVPITIIFIFWEHERPAMQDFLESRQIQHLNTIDGLHFYQYPVDKAPQQQ